MFTKQKKNYRTFIYTALVITLCLLVIALLWPKETAGDDHRVNAQSQTEEEKNQDGEEPVNSQKADNVDKEDGDDEKEQPDDKKSDINDNLESYYVVRKDGSQISVYFSDGKGSEVKLETTDILYELLPADDQRAFEQGVKVGTQEELAALLQDFES